MLLGLSHDLAVLSANSTSTQDYVVGRKIMSTSMSLGDQHLVDQNQTPSPKAFPLGAYIAVLFIYPCKVRIFYLIGKSVTDSGGSFGSVGKINRRATNRVFRVTSDNKELIKPDVITNLCRLWSAIISKLDTTSSAIVAHQSMEKVSQIKEFSPLISCNAARVDGNIFDEGTTSKTSNTHTLEYMIMIEDLGISLAFQLTRLLEIFAGTTDAKSWLFLIGGNVYHVNSFVCRWMTGNFNKKLKFQENDFANLESGSME